ncbi:DEAD/DEAH box helicase [Heyndrickxia acidiproducens]|uniref:DEAD/DEAH box helicase n=1 Tax=Heyndrickxia acidiproducens TaxID=1121084 RepID=UPI0003634B0E|nr:DEAD/DEAH box helicase [Heyndrickxia acidiproducens]
MSPLPYTPSKQLQYHLSGRKLLETEIPFPAEWLKTCRQNGWIHEEKGISGEYPDCTCKRCGNQNPHLFAAYPCAHCGEMSIYCRNCIMMGRVSSCLPLISWTGPEPEFTPPHAPLQWAGQLSKGQQAASDAVLDALQHKKELLLWAVCGAGKTEVLFAGIEAAIKAGRRVCVATPRTDVVLELTPRFRQVFPEIKVAALYGGSPDRHLWAPLVVATTHQLYRYEAAFDAIIVDEVDAFPYTYDTTLQKAVQKAAKKDCARIFLTATPNEKWQQECQAGKRSHVMIPARFHRHPLPVPVMKWIGNWRRAFEKGRLPGNIEAWMKRRLSESKQALVFLPNIRLMLKAAPLFQALDEKIEWVHAEDPDRKQKVENMRAQKTPILLTTTILERGVTFPNIDVAVVGAEDEIFTEAALVQIAGRAGRSPAFPSGEVTFFHYGRTKAMLKAVRHIASMNEEARKRGLVDE